MTSREDAPTQKAAARSDVDRRGCPEDVELTPPGSLARRIEQLGRWRRHLLLVPGRDRLDRRFPFRLRERRGLPDLRAAQEKLVGHMLCDVFPAQRRSGQVLEWANVFETGRPLERES
jgi:hypothetical protein